MNVIKLIINYLLIIIERIYLLPLSNIRPSMLTMVFKNEFEAKRLLKRLVFGTIIYGILTLILCQMIRTVLILGLLGTILLISSRIIKVISENKAKKEKEKTEIVHEPK